MKLHICWSIDCESSRKEINDTDLGRKALEGFCGILDDRGWPGTLFLTPEEIGPLCGVAARIAEKGHEIALHLHPDETGYRSGYMGVYTYDEQLEIIHKAVRRFIELLGIRPYTARTGYGSANDSTFRALHDAGFRQTSTSFPGRTLTGAASNWAGAPLFAHYADLANRMLEGDPPLVELPISVDWESIIWGGRHPQDLRVEFTDAKNHSYVIRKVIARQVEQALPFKAIVPFTHNIFDYSDVNNFRRETMTGINSYIDITSRELGIITEGATMAAAADIFRRTVHD